MLKKSLCMVMVMGALLSCGCQSQNNSVKSENNKSVESIEKDQEVNETICEIIHTDAIILTDIMIYERVTNNQYITLNLNTDIIKEELENKDLSPEYIEMIYKYLAIHDTAVAAIDNGDLDTIMQCNEKSNEFVKEYDNLINYTSWLENQ